jgi:hypothetical protein
MFKQIVECVLTVSLGTINSYVFCVFVDCLFVCLCLFCFFVSPFAAALVTFCATLCVRVCVCVCVSEHARAGSKAL